MGSPTVRSRQLGAVAARLRAAQGSSCIDCGPFRDHRPRRQRQQPFRCMAADRQLICLDLLLRWRLRVLHRIRQMPEPARLAK